MKSLYRKQVIEVCGETLDELQKAAAAAGISLNSQICIALEMWVQNRKRMRGCEDDGTIA